MTVSTLVSPQIPTQVSWKVDCIHTKVKTAMSTDFPDKNKVYINQFIKTKITIQRLSLDINNIAL